MQPAPETPESHLPVPDAQDQKRTSFIILLRDAFLLLGRYFVVVYPIFLYFILRSVLSPKALPNFSNWQWWVVVGGFMAIWFLIEAGWHTMMLEAVKIFEKERTTPLNAEESMQMMFPFSLLKWLFPGIGENGVTFLTGGILNVLLFAIPAALIVFAGYHFIGLPQTFLPFLTSTTLNTDALEKAFMSATPKEQAQLALWDLIFLSIFGVIFIVKNLTMYWQPYALIKKINPLHAFFRSIRFVFKHPILTLQILALSIVLGFTAFVIASLPTWIAFLGLFILIVALVYLQFLLYLILFRFDGPEPGSDLNEEPA